MFDREKSEELEGLPPVDNSEATSGDACCAGCFTTWETVRREGRAGCAACYETFRALLADVMARVQHGDFHTGKMPRAAQKRARRGDNLRKRRENQLELLQNRLQLALASEEFEEAALLRDKIQNLV